MSLNYTFAPRLLALAAAISATSAWSAEQPVSADARTAELEQRLLSRERKLEIQTEESEKKAKDTPTVSAGDKGFGIKKGDFEIKFSALAQADFRAYLGDEETINQVVYAAPTNNGTKDYTVPVSGVSQIRTTPQSVKYNDGFVVRRIRPTIQGTVGKLVGFRFTPELAGSGVGDASGNSVVDAYIDLKFSPKALMRSSSRV